MRSRASEAAMAISRSQSVNSMKMLAPSEVAEERMRLIPVMVASASSVGRMMVRSTSSGVEPV
ncbi:hypothetical protein D3C71_1193400 [compost metagenome]